MNILSIVSFLLITGLVAVISAIKTRKKKVQTTSGLFFADHNNNFFIVGGALLLSNISANQFIGENESIYTNNMSVMAWGVSSVLAMLLVAEFFLPIYFRTGAMTIPDYLGKRYDQSTKRLVSIIFLCSYIVNLLPAVLYGGAVALTGMFNFLDPLQLTYWKNIWVMVWLIGLTGCAYSVLGGLRAISISDTVLSVGLLTIGIA
ncbi:MAG: solute:sodium symporter family transporter, partial [Flavobacterium nitrogenifigens]|uniref:sodium:solute symporter family transporter n=1 Tax=Flavobacterium nitrogenifigens TaxID=1617283 RepID=UPI002807899D|nr:solute:sodium symporter family transporter [Flavobacterium nitrogenifigens]